MNTLHLAWMLGRPAAGRKGPLLLTLAAYTVVSALVLIVVNGALSFTRFDAEPAAFYLPLAGIAVMMLIIPLIVLGMSAARLSARSQDLTLSSLRLLGATGTQVRLISLVQACGTALVGAIAGVVLYYVLAPLVSLVRFQGEPIGVGMLGTPLAILAVILCVVLLSALSSILGLRQLVITPLAVRQRSNVPVPSWIRVLVVLVVLGTLYLVFSNLGALAQDIATLVLVLVLVIGLGIGLGIMNLIGPWLVAKVGRSKLRKAQTAEDLLAARMILESPQQSWRQVSGVAMAAFVAVVGGSGAALMQATGGSAGEGWEAHLATDVLTGVLLTLLISFVCVAASTAITQTASTLDRRDLYQGLGQLGVPAKMLNQARIKSVMIPTLSAAIGFALASAVLVFPLAGAAIILKPLTVAVVLISVVLGLLMVRAAVAVAAPRPMAQAAATARSAQRSE